ncbi:c-type cytochrome domain-containing protein, partial [Parapedobacter pyrenivorans]|uniref:c-type cytochrome domain-containing protein n=1 Tax=Parapedobacter pyrenivorans TaxID=1305674 RepID=UPI00333E51F3
MLDLAAWKVRFQYLRQAVPFVLFVGFISAVVACLFGYLLSLSGDYDAVLLDRHKLSGIALAVCAGILLVIRLQITSFSPRLFSGLLVGMLVLISYSGHQGGNLTHGSDYLSMQTLLEEEREKPVSPSVALLYEDVVHPVLQQKCGQCHRSGKRKGEFSLSSHTELIAGGKSGPAIVPGKLAESELYRRITLDPAHEEFMPTDGKPPLTEDETALIAYWIEQAGAATSKSMGALQANDTLLMQV